MLSSVVVNTVIDGLFPPSSGIVSLRNALATADASSTATTISFDPMVFATPQTIMLNGTGLVLGGAQPITINGPSVGVTINGNGQGTVLSIGGGTNSLSRLTIMNGSEGGISNSGDLTVISSDILNNSGAGGLSNSGTATLDDVAVSNNSNSNSTGGGGITNDGSLSSLTLSNVTVSDNTESNGGAGGIGNFFGATLNLMNVGITGNTAAMFFGGGIYNDGRGTLTGVTLSGNTAAEGGGGIENFGGALGLTNVTITNNTSASGGGIENSGTLTVTNASIVGNTSNSAGGIANLYGGTVTISNSILDENTLSGTGSAGANASGSFNSLGFNLVGTTDGSTGWNGSDLTDVTNPQLGPLGDYGGPTQTIPLLPGSPAIDRGNNALAVDATDNPLKTDQRGLPRIVNGIVDIGAFEVQPPPVIHSVTVNDGAQQRSIVRTVTLAFSEPVALTKGALTLSRRNTGGSGTNDGAAPTDLTADLSFANPAGDGMTWIVSFLPNTAAADASGGLDDGIYDLTIHGAGVTAKYGGSFADQTFTFHRLFGDINGDKTVNNSDYFKFNKAFNSKIGEAGYAGAFDFNRDGIIDNSDYFKFNRNFGRTFIY